MLMLLQALISLDQYGLVPDFQVMPLPVNQVLIALDGFFEKILSVRTDDRARGGKVLIFAIDCGNTDHRHSCEGDLFVAFSVVDLYLVPMRRKRCF
jgi:hypothetical protein